MAEFDMGAYARDVARVLSEKSSEEWEALTGDNRWTWHVTAADGATYALSLNGSHRAGGGSITATAVFSRANIGGGESVTDEWWRDNDYQVIPNFAQRSEKFSVPATKIIKAATLAGRILTQVKRYRDELAQCGKRMTVALDWQMRHDAAEAQLDAASDGRNGTFGGSHGHIPFSGTYDYFSSSDDVKLDIRVPHSLAVDILAMITKRKGTDDNTP